MKIILLSVAAIVLAISDLASATEEKKAPPAVTAPAAPTPAPTPASEHPSEHPNK